MCMHAYALPLPSLYRSHSHREGKLYSIVPAIRGLLLCSQVHLISLTCPMLEGEEIDPMTWHAYIYIYMYIYIYTYISYRSNYDIDFSFILDIIIVLGRLICKPN